MARGDTVRYASEYERTLAKMLRSVAQRHNLWQVFRDFVAMNALAISNAVDPMQFDEREAEFFAIKERYSAEEMALLSSGLANVVMALEAGHQDFLGSLFMAMELGDSWKGQFFTPYPVCLLMAKMTLDTSETRAAIAEKGFVTVNDPCTGGGAMLIAAAHAMQEAGFNYQQAMHVTAQDIDIVAVHMTYIQLSLLYVPAVVIHGNSLAVETRSVWRTPAHQMGFWASKLRRAEEAEHAASKGTEHIASVVAIPNPAPLFVPSMEAQRAAANDAVDTPRPRRQSQYSLF